MPPGTREIVFEPHVAAAIGCLLLALIAAVLAFVLGLTEDERRK